MTTLLVAACGDIVGRGHAITAHETSPPTLSRAALGQVRFVFDDMNGLTTDRLETVALPWKLATTALLLENAGASGVAPHRSQLPAILGRFGFITPTRIANWLGPQPGPRLDGPIGIITGDIISAFPSLRVEAANLGCAACHGGVTYDPEGFPQAEIWIGQPNTSLNLQAYALALYRAVKSSIASPEKLIAAIRGVYPETSAREIETLRGIVLPRVAARIAELTHGIDRPLPFDNGASGLTNGVAALKFHLGGRTLGRAGDETGFTSIPDIGGTPLRTSLLVDGFYGVPGTPRFAVVSPEDRPPLSRDDLAHLVAIFTVPALGVDPDQAITLVPRARDILGFIAAYRPPPFPGSIDRRKAARGRALYDEHCAACHGVYSKAPPRPELVVFPNRLVPQSAMGTDATRWQRADQALADRIGLTVFAGRIAPAQTGGYVATALTGLWATAPYLHNGSVPTLWHLMRPEKRPARFQVGGHRLDFTTVGIAGKVGSDGTMVYAKGFRPWAEPTTYDTRTPGRGNGGHESAFAPLGEAQKDALLEFLKLL